MQKSMAPYLPEGKSGHLVTFLAGMLVTLSLAPYGLWPAAIASMVLYTLSLFKLSPKQAFWRGWWFGFGVYLSGASWVYVSIHLHGNASVELASIMTGFFCAGLAFFYAIPSYFYAKFFRDKKAAFISFAAVYVLNEWIRTWLLTGFPWLFLGYNQIDAPLAGWAPVVGTIGISAIIALTGSTLAFYLLDPTRKKLILLSAIVACWIAGPFLNKVEWTSPAKDKPITVGTIQANIPQEKKWLTSELHPTLKLYRDMTMPLLKNDIVVWPETAVPRVYQKATGFLNSMRAIAAQNNSTIITGIPYVEYSDDNPPKRTIYNSIVALGEEDGVYHKRRLVPFGEYVPLESLIRGVIDFFDLPMSNFTSGPSTPQILSAGGIKLAPFLCYEIVYPELVRKDSSATDVLITLSNDTWFGDSNGPLQHMEMARMRALENGRYLIRGTNNGITALIDHKGKVTQEIEQFTRGTMEGEVIAMKGSTPFTQFGHWPVLILSVLWLLGLLLISSKRQPNQTT